MAKYVAEVQHGWQVVYSDGSPQVHEVVVEMLKDFSRTFRVGKYTRIDPETNTTLFIVTDMRKAGVNFWKIEAGMTILFHPKLRQLKVMTPAPTVNEKAKIAEAEKALGSSEADLTPEQLYYINTVAPEHCRSSCGDGDNPRYNAWYGKDDVLFGRCTRCTLVNAALGDNVPDVDD